jgi:hypothetical protein
MRTKQKELKREWFIVMNSQLEYFSGLMYGGQLVWCSDYNEAKPLDDEAKFRTLQHMCYNEELVMDYIK